MRELLDMEPETLSETIKTLDISKYSYGIEYGNFYPFGTKQWGILQQWKESGKQPPKTTIKPEMVKCDCGHTIPKKSVMNASSGTSCPDCYDSMSVW